MEHLDVGGVVVVDPHERDLALYLGKFDRVRRVDDVGLGVEHLEDADARRHGALHLGVLHRQVADGVEEALDVQREGHEYGNFEASAEDEVAAEDHDDSERGRHERLDFGQDQRGEATRLQVALEVLVVHVVEVGEVTVLPVEALDHADAGDALLQVGVHQRDRLPHADEGEPRPALPDRDADEEHGHHGERRRGQPGLHQEHGDEDPHQRQEVGDSEDGGREELL